MIKCAYNAIVNSDYNSDSIKIKLRDFIQTYSKTRIQEVCGLSDKSQQKNIDKMLKDSASSIIAIFNNNSVYTTNYKNEVEKYKLI